MTEWHSTETTVSGDPKAVRAAAKAIAKPVPTPKPDPLVSRNSIQSLVDVVIFCIAALLIVGTLSLIVLIVTLVGDLTKVVGGY